MPINILGSSEPELVLYLPNPPLLPSEQLMGASGSGLNIPELIELNGNHWRKILTILAKICAPDGDWRQYRDHQLLKQKEAVCFGDSLLSQPAQHLVAGKASWERLGLETHDFVAVDDQQRAWKRDQVFLVPYLDYRQFPNALVDKIKHCLNVT
ncbi:DUF6942 family protein [Motiliproteus sp. MSK22-1]|uniref:DUF6942 family protein n=1 Tax=Motiliproteus sp. MSK22-1 TaxID=1897630 RepID=UPI0009777431|nr:hypothetical protein [Motiliproteus sp. MSK22-1]OMH27967.1 hypothetical protein BGP75_21555 [Motiliproteus sp. MSK22-1]